MDAPMTIEGGPDDRPQRSAADAQGAWLSWPTRRWRPTRRYALRLVVRLLRARVGVDLRLTVARRGRGRRAQSQL